MKYDKSVFCDDTGKRVVVGLFEEFDRPDRKFRPRFKLADWKETFLEARDPSEYEAAMRLVGDWDHWLLIRQHPFISPIIDKWHEELEIKLRSEAIKKMLYHANQPGGTAAAKWLADKGYSVDAPKKKVGRPISKEAPIEETTEHAEDLVRLGLRVVGSK